MRSEWIAVGLGGALGSIARHSVNTLVARRYGPDLPYATLVVNLIGCGVIGLLAGLLAAERIAMTPAGRAFVFAGILGGFTTFSSFGLDTFTLARTGRPGAALWNVVVQVAVGLAAVAGGFFVGTRVGSH